MLGDEQIVWGDIVWGDKVIVVSNGERKGWDFNAPEAIRDYLANGEVGFAAKPKNGRYLNIALAQRPHRSPPPRWRVGSTRPASQRWRTRLLGPSASRGPSHNLQPPPAEARRVEPQAVVPAALDRRDGSGGHATLSCEVGGGGYGE